MPHATKMGCCNHIYSWYNTSQMSQGLECKSSRLGQHVITNLTNLGQEYSSIVDFEFIHDARYKM